MFTALDIKAYALQKFFNLWGHLGRFVLNLGRPKGLTVLRDLPYGTDPKQRLDIFHPRGPEANDFSILVYFHGGGWISADKKIYDGICAQLSSNGFMICNVNYRLAPRHRFPAPLQDAAQAIEWIENNAARFGGDPTRMVLAGDSAGAHIASWYASALHKEDLFRSVGIDSRLSSHCLRGLLLFYGVYDFSTVLDAPFPFIKIYAKSFLGAEPDEYAKNAVLASPIKHITADLPAVFLCAGQRDGLYAQTLAYTASLEQSGIRCRTQLFSKAQRASHGFLFFRWLKASKTTFAAVREYLQTLN